MTSTAWTFTVPREWVQEFRERMRPHPAEDGGVESSGEPVLSRGDEVGAS